MLNQIYYLQTYDYSINIGRGYNESIKHFPDDAWICINDHDSMFMYPKFGHQLNDVINRYGKEYALFGCVTNRLGGLHQLHNNEFSNDMDVRNHYQIAIDRARQYGTDVEETTGVAGVLMLFNKRTWEAVGGFKEKTIIADTEFNKSIKAKKLGKIGLMKGVYLFHNYRIWQQDHKKAWADTRHLKK